LTGEGVRGTIDLAGELYKQAGTRVSTAKVNQVLQEALLKRSPKSRGAALPKIYFASQVDVHPPTIVIFANKPEFFSPDYIRYIENALRKSLPFAEVPLKLIMRERTSFFEKGKSSG
jgi:GTP-binding protein